MQSKLVERMMFAAVSESPPWVSESPWIIVAPGQQARMKADVLTSWLTGKNENNAKMTKGITTNFPKAAK